MSALFSAEVKHTCNDDCVGNREHTTFTLNFMNLLSASIPVSNSGVTILPQEESRLPVLGVDGGDASVNKVESTWHGWKRIEGFGEEAYNQSLETLTTMITARQEKVGKITFIMYSCVNRIKQHNIS